MNKINKNDNRLSFLTKFQSMLSPNNHILMQLLALALTFGVKGTTRTKICLFQVSTQASTRESTLMLGVNGPFES